MTRKLSCCQPTHGQFEIVKYTEVTTYTADTDQIDFSRRFEMNGDAKARRQQLLKKGESPVRGCVTCACSSRSRAVVSRAHHMVICPVTLSIVSLSKLSSSAACQKPEARAPTLSSSSIPTFPAPQCYTSQCKPWRCRGHGSLQSSEGRGSPCRPPERRAFRRSTRA